MGQAKRHRASGYVRPADEHFSVPNKPGATITLQNPVALAGHFPQWIFGNACQWEQMAMRSLADAEPAAMEVLAAKLAADGLPLPDRMGLALAAIEQAGSNTHVAMQGSGKGQHLLICGAGVSLRETAAEWCDKGDQVWGCNSAATWLYEQGYKVTHAFTVDQTAEMLNEWRSTPPIDYLLATTVHPHLTELIVGRGRPVTFFHNFVGIMHAPVEIDGRILPYEDWLYQIFFPSTIRCGAGLNSVNRAVDLAEFMGFDKITILGADCALRFSTAPPPADLGMEAHARWLREEVEMHADGGHALVGGQSAITLMGRIDGRDWLTKTDMIVSAVHLVKARQKMNAARPGWLEFVGDTLPNAIKDKPDSYLQQLPALVGPDGTDAPMESGSH